MMSTISEEASAVYSSLRSLEIILNNKQESFPNKIQSLIQVWRQVNECQSETAFKGYEVHLMNWLKLHTLNIVLNGDWKNYKDDYEKPLLDEVLHCELQLRHANNIFTLRCRKLAEIIQDPWGNDVLSRLLNHDNVNLGPEEMDFFATETGYLISTRLKKLCEDRCEDMALNLATNFMRCQELAERQQINLNATDAQKLFILDVYIALLDRINKTSLIIATFKTLSLKKGLEFLNRFTNKRINISKIWRHSKRVANLAAQYFTTSAVTTTPEEAEENNVILKKLLETWLVRWDVTDAESFMNTFRRIIQQAMSAVYIYTICKAIYDKFGHTMKTFIVELYIHALTTDMNDLERQKHDNESTKVEEIQKRLAAGFVCLAEVLHEDLLVSRECILTAFSLQPTEANLEEIGKLAEQSGYEVLDTGQSWKCKLHPPVHPSDEVCFPCSQCGDLMSQPQYQFALNTNTALMEATEHLGLRRELCDDLVVVLSSPRYQLLSWLLPWKDLNRLCILYLKDPEGTKNLVKELKFLDIDYSQFKIKKEVIEDEPQKKRGRKRRTTRKKSKSRRSKKDEYLEDSCPYSLGSDGTGDSTSTLFPPHVAKSDPNVLKRLRQFRPRLKRCKQSPPDSEVPSKIFITSQPVLPLASASPTTSSAHNLGQPNNYFYMSNVNHMSPYNPHMGKLPAQFPSLSNVGPWHLPGQSASRSNIEGSFNSAVNQSNPYTQYGGKCLSNPSSGYNYFMGNSTGPPEAHGVSDSSYVNSSKEVALNLSMNHQAHAVSKKPIEQPAYLNPSKGYANQRDFSNSQNNSKPEKTNKYKGSLEDTRLRSLLESDATDRIKERGKWYSRNMNSKSSDGEKFKASKNKLTTKRCSSKVEKLLQPPVKIQENPGYSSYLNMSKNLIPSTSENLNNEKSTCHTLAHSVELSQKLSYSSSKFMDSSRSLLELASTSRGKETTNSRATPVISKAFSTGTHLKSDRNKNKSNCYVETVPLKTSLKNATSLNSNSEIKSQPTANTLQTSATASSITETERSTFSAALSTLYANMSKNVITLASSGIGKSSENHYLQETKTSAMISDSSVNKSGDNCSQSANVTDTTSTTSDGGVQEHSENHRVENAETDTNKVLSNELEKVEETQMVLKETQSFQPEVGTNFSCPTGDDNSTSNTNKRENKCLEVAVVDANNKSSSGDLKKIKLNEVCEASTKNKALSEDSKKTKELIVQLASCSTPDDYCLTGVKPSTNNKILESNTNRSNPPTVETDNTNKILGDNLNKVKEVQLSVNSEIVINSSHPVTVISKNNGHKSFASHKVESKKHSVEPFDTVAGRDDLHSFAFKKRRIVTVDEFENHRGKFRTKVISTVRQHQTIVARVDYNKTPVHNCTICDSLCTHNKNSVENFSTCSICGFSCDCDNATLHKNAKHGCINRGSVGTAACEINKVGQKTVSRNDCKTEKISNKLEYFKRKYKFKQVRVVIQRLTEAEINEYINNNGKCYSEFVKHNSKPKSTRRVTKKSENKIKDKPKAKSKNLKNKDDSKPWPLQDINPKVNRRREVKADILKKDKCKPDFRNSKFMNPCVVLKRLELDSKDKKRFANSVLANVPGLNDLQMIRPSSVDRIVQVVQVPGARSTTSVPVQSTQTSTQVTPHIQRIGQPRTEKPEPSDADSSCTSTTSPMSNTVSTTTSDSSTLINILSQQIMRPNNQTNCVGVRPRTSPVINILSQQIIKPGSSVPSTTKVSTSGSTEVQRSNMETKTFQSSAVYAAYQGKIKKTQVTSQRLDRELQQLSFQRKQAALERELRLQKSLSEECEDLGVDEPSTSDLFPEADLLFDNHSPGYDQTSQDLMKRPSNVQEVKEETKTIGGLFCDDEPMRTDFLFEPVEYQSAAVELEYNRSRDMTNGQGSTSNESALSCEDNTLLQTCTSMSDVTITSPISPDPYTDNSPPPLNKCKYKYSNRKKAERSKHAENWPMESSSEDTTGSTELTKSCSRSPELYPGKRNQNLNCEDELYGFAIVESLPLKDEEECEEVHCEEVVDCPSGRGARRSVKKLCSCCNGSAKVARKRPASRPPTPFSHKKTVIAKKR